MLEHASAYKPKLFIKKNSTKNKVKLLHCKSIKCEWQNETKQNKVENKEVVWQQNMWHITRHIELIT